MPLDSLQTDCLSDRHFRLYAESVVYGDDKAFTLKKLKISLTFISKQFNFNYISAFIIFSLRLFLLHGFHPHSPIPLQSNINYEFLS